MINSCIDFLLKTLFYPRTPQEDCVSLESFSERIAQIRACETRVFEFRLDKPNHFVEFVAVDSELQKAERLLPHQTMKATALQINAHIKNASFLLSRAEKTPIWHRIT